MPALISLQQAKDHLRVRTSDSDGDIYVKVQQASAIVLDYLKSRVHRTFTIDTSSVASPTVITTTEPHGYSNGETVIIADHADSTPALLGSYVVSNVTEYSFTVPVAVTVAGSGGTATVQWSPVTAPGPVQSAVFLVLTHLYEHRGDDMQADAALWDAIGRLLARSRDPALV